MNTSDRFLAGLAACLLAASCVTETTTSRRATPSADDADAAELNYQLGARYYRNGNYY